MKLHKVINNSIVSAYDSEGREVVVMGRGIGFAARPGSIIDEGRIEKIFCIEDEALSRRFRELLPNIPVEHMKISADIIEYGKSRLNIPLNQGIYVTLTDHISFAIKRFKEGMRLTNALLLEIKRFYRTEYTLGMYALGVIRERLRLTLPEDEAGFIALHFVNAEYGTNLQNTMDMTQMIQGCLKQVREEFHIELDQDSLHYDRFVTHLKFLVQRIYRHEMLGDSDVGLADVIRAKYPEEYACSRRMADYISRNFHEHISEEEQSFLTIHIRRVCMSQKEQGLDKE